MPLLWDAIRRLPLIRNVVRRVALIMDAPVKGCSQKISAAKGCSQKLKVSPVKGGPIITPSMGCTQKIVRVKGGSNQTATVIRESVRDDAGVLNRVDATLGLVEEARVVHPESFLNQEEYKLNLLIQHRFQALIVGLMNFERLIRDAITEVTVTRAVRAIIYLNHNY